MTLGDEGVFYSSASSFFNNVLRDDFLDIVEDSIINPKATRALFQEDTTRTYGKNIVFPIHTDRNFGGNAIAAGALLPEPKAQGYDKYSFPWRHYYQRVLFDGISMHASSSSVAAWLEVMDSEMAGALSDTERDLQRQIHNDGSGRLAMIETGASSATQTVEINQDVEGAANVPVSDFPPTTYIEVGMRLMVVDPTGATVRGVRTVVSFTDTTVTFDSTIATTTGDWVVKASNLTTSDSADSGWHAEGQGLAGIFSDGNPDDGVTGFQGIDATSPGNEFNQAIVLEAVASGLAPLSESLLQRTFSRTEKLAGVRPDLMISPFEILDAYIDLLIADKRFPSTTELSGGVTGIDFKGAMFVPDRDCYGNRIYFLKRDNLRRFMGADPGWIDNDGSIVSRLENRDAFQATYYNHETLGTGWRKRNAALINVASG